MSASSFAVPTTPASQLSQPHTPATSATPSASFESVPYAYVQERDIPATKYTLVEFPGVVQNVERAVRMLGGIRSIEKASRKFKLLFSKGMTPLNLGNC